MCIGLLVNLLNQHQDTQQIVDVIVIVMCSVSKS